MTQNTNVEWMAECTQNGTGLLVTTHDEKSVNSEKARAEYGIESKDITIQIHGHPGKKALDGSTSEGTRGGSRGDMDRVTPGIRYFINHQGTGLIYEYNSTQQCVVTPQTFEEWMKNNTY